MTNEALLAQSQKKVIDRITLITDDIFQFLRNMTEYFRVGPWHVTHCADETGETICHEAIMPVRNGMEIQVVEPVAKGTVYADFYARYGCGIMGMRERVPEAEWDAMLSRFRNLGAKVIPDACADVVWVDLMDTMGAIMSFIKAESAIQPATGGTVNICQICLVTDDILKLAHNMVEYFGVGPWEIGKANNNTFTDLQCGGYAPGEMPDPDFLVGIGFYGQLQVELIQPNGGPVPYFGFLNRRGPGFHHIKQMLTKKGYNESLVRISDMGLRPALAGKISGCPWCNWDTEAMFGFVFEMNDDSTFDALPKGYDPYYVQ